MYDVIMYKYTNDFESLLTSTNIAKNNALKRNNSRLSKYHSKYPR